ncbi:hypothetical protein SAMN04487965_0508 [Microbulbifer donghaiensis]|uniref:Phosphate-starvation-inducible E n=1 Tax=Microbulbifer donghaiensis TaxID=494016 RepID=A0A1M4VSY3_9GAMM|nr:hypothetical protein [Microbulbifer donghaiensis]SHE72136.1 hypothetical protein SAMN04487965_0508 [Microbulbifer donghaiensis]
MAETKRTKFSTHSVFAWLFALLFLTLCAAILISTISTFVQFFFSSEIFYSENEIPEVIINAISNLIIALAMFELYVVIKINIHAEDQLVALHSLLESAPRFIIVVCAALALEGLVLVIKLIQDQKTEELLAPIAVIFSAATLLVALGVFLKICPHRIGLAEDSDDEPET